MSKKQQPHVVLIQFLLLLLLLLIINHRFSRYIRVDIRRVRKQREYQESSSSPSLVKLNISQKNVEIDNGIIKLVLLNPHGMISAVSYKGINNVLEPRNKLTQRGYWDIVWYRPDINIGNFEPFQSKKFRVIANTKEYVEVSFTSTWNNVSSPKDMAPLKVDKRFMVLRGVSGFYTYAIFEHQEGWPDLNIVEARIAIKLNSDIFHYMAISDDMQRIMPTERNRRSGRPLIYREAKVITNPRNPNLKGEVDDKYQYSVDNKDNRVHGWISTEKQVGFWVITPSDEFRGGGPIKPDLTSHVGPTSLVMFHSRHYAGEDFGLKLRKGEPWKKVFGPIFMYLNSDSTNSTTTLWNDAKEQMLKETSKWPYDFPVSSDFPRANQRGAICGRLLVRDKYIDTKLVPAKFAYIGLAPPGSKKSWQNDVKGYQFWTRTNKTGYFTIKNIRADKYNLYAWVPGIIGDYKNRDILIIQPGNQVQMGNLIHKPPRNGPTLWEIGIPDRSAAEFYIPDPDPNLVNKLFLNKDKYRQYGLWDRYTDNYPKQDLKYKVGESDYRKDWFFAHVNRKIGNGSYIPTTWEVSFELKNIATNGSYTLRLALAAATVAHIQVRINNPNVAWPHFWTGKIGKDNAISRHGIRGEYWLFNIDICGCRLVNGENKLYLSQVKTDYSPFNGVLYDYIRLEGPSEG
ncbi:uncharacterized protein LOC127266604 [Andrographis paniculata]|uniref:uncharacterized protein LOC127266604 n=1 Tax=Andrographis paniculata TaxID=175694 RepID=UPI0021E9596C|nr:uncharacterized protein LOC127266604 [Andrographis paniculata]